jgi:hypothetical protein
MGDNIKMDPKKRVIWLRTDQWQAAVDTDLNDYIP